MRLAGIEVWFDQSELRGGDAWDQSIRKQIKTCGLFLPLISKHTHERAWEQRNTDIAALLYDPFIRRFKDDPRFAAFCRKVGLPVPGEAYAHKPT